jgi:hypothetical protein
MTETLSKDLNSVKKEVMTFIWTQFNQFYWHECKLTYINPEFRPNAWTEFPSEDVVINVHGIKEIQEDYNQFKKYEKRVFLTLLRFEDRLQPGNYFYISKMRYEYRCDRVISHESRCKNSDPLRAISGAWNSTLFQFKSDLCNLRVIVDDLSDDNV